MYKIAVLYICTGDYIIFWKEFYDSFQKFFLPESFKEYFVFTDAGEIYGQNYENIHKVYQGNLGWPGNTLKRFHMFMDIEERLEVFDFIFFFNSNLVCQEIITEKEFLPQKNQNLVVVKHPGWVNDMRLFYTYERRPKSQAYIPYNKGKYYVCGGVNGGRAAFYVKLIEDLRNAIDMDLERGIIARYHDESHLNKYILGRTDVRILGPEYCYPEGYNLSCRTKLLLLNKSNYIDVNKIKGNRVSIFLVVKSYIIEILRRICRIFVPKAGR